MPHLTTHITKGWIEVRGPSGIVYDGPLDLSTKQRTRVEIDWIHQKTGLDRPSLYDAIREYNRSARANYVAKPVLPAPARAINHNPQETT